jgi:hypothetical protein
MHPLRFLAFRSFSPLFVHLMMDSLLQTRQYINPIVLLAAVFDLLFVIILQYLQPLNDVALPLLTDIVNTLLYELLLQA